MKKIFLALLFLMFVNPAFADTVAFGMTLGKTTESEAKKIYQLQSAGINKHTRGNMYHVLNTNFMADLKSMMLVFDRQGTLMGIMAVFPRAKLRGTVDSLYKKYKLVYGAIDRTRRASINIPFGGIGFDADDTEIHISYNKYDADARLLYSHKLYVAMQAEVEKEEQIQRQKQIDAARPFHEPGLYPCRRLNGYGPPQNSFGYTMFPGGTCLY